MINWYKMSQQHEHGEITKTAEWFSNPQEDQTEYNERALRILFNFVPRLRDLFKNKIKNGKNEPSACREIFDYYVKVDDDLKEDYMILLKQLESKAHPLAA